MQGRGIKKTVLQGAIHGIGISALLLSFGLGEDGHRICGQIAWQHLTPATQQAVSALLEQDDDRYHTLAGASVWADDIRGDRDYDWAKPLHYVNIPKGKPGYDARRDCPDGACVVAAIGRFLAVLQDADATANEKLEALKFLAHFVEDLHQPLHAGHKEDRGGNSINVKFFSKKTNLHSLWDTGLIRRAGMRWQEYAEQLSADVTPEERHEWGSDLDPNSWVDESFRLAVRHAYAIPSSRKLGESYYRANRPILEIQMKKAGVRLAAMLNRVYEAGDDAEDAPVDELEATALPADVHAMPSLEHHGATGLNSVYTQCLNQARQALDYYSREASPALSSEAQRQVAPAVFMETYEDCLERNRGGRE